MFVAAWTALEQLLISQAQQHEERVLTLGQALRTLRKRGKIPEAVLTELEHLRRLRNRAVRGHDTPSDEILRQATERVERLRENVRPEQG
jgi:uncharacterized protein YutE (UPF0331/DUF86 family)